MPLYELEEGTSRKFYRIELHGTRVHLHWGRIGTEGEHQIIPCANEAAARAEYQRQLDKRTERGYRKVVDETVPHDPEAAEKARLAKTGTLSESPRFLFMHRKKQRFAWVEARGTELVYARGPAADVATTLPKTKPFASEAAAIRERDAMVAALIDKGYELETFGKKETPKPRVKKALAFDEDLERAIAENHDDAAWTVLEDWVLQQEDPRAELVRLGKARQRGDEVEARAAALPLLFGTKHEALFRAVERSAWRAGHILECRYTEPTRSADAVSACFYASPSARLLRGLELWVPNMSRFAAQLALIAKSPCARSLRTIAVTQTKDGEAGVVEAAALANIERLETLIMHGPTTPKGQATLPALHVLQLTVASPTALAAWCTQTFPALRALTIGVRWRTANVAGALAPLLAGTAAPMLQSFGIHGIGIGQLAPVVERSPLRARLTSVSVTG